MKLLLAKHSVCAIISRHAMQYWYMHSMFKCCHGALLDWQHERTTALTMWLLHARGTLQIHFKRTLGRMHKHEAVAVFLIGIAEPFTVFYVFIVPVFCFPGFWTFFLPVFLFVLVCAQFMSVADQSPFACS